MSEPVYRILDIIRGTTVDGPGFRTSIYFAGCRHKCKGCHNPQSWDSNKGTEMTLSQIMEIVNEEDFNVTLSGGDPLYDPFSVRHLIEVLKENNRNVWVYTGFTWEEIIGDKILKDAIKMADVLIDGKFIESLHNPDLPFRGSSNQRLIDVRKSIETGQILVIK